MNDKGKIVAGLLIFFAALTFPFWYNMGKAAPGPEIVLSETAKKAGECVLPKEQMRVDHMQLLDVWRDTVVRDATRMYTNQKGKRFNMSLSNTCMECHDNKAAFCDQCHNYTSTRPYCWTCHIENPKEKE
jgi:hypothetical protein